MLTDLEKPPAPAPAIEDLRARLRLPTGFEDDAAMALKLGGLISLALRVVEERTGHALLRRRFVLRDAARGAEAALPLPRRPVHSVESVSLERAPGGAEALSPDAWRLTQSRGAPALLLTVAAPADSFVEVTFAAGHAAHWLDAPEDLRHAVIEIAAGYFDAGAPVATPPLPAAAALLLAPYRQVRL